jgi:thiosulfate/3-mercaptopyruvate sulfurtransferase
MPTFVKHLFKLGAAAMFVVAMSGCSDSTTEPKETPAYPNEAILVSGETLEANLEAPNQVIVDTRKTADYDAGHIPNAISLPVSPGGGSFDIGGDGTNRTDLKPPAEIAIVLGNAGLTEATRIVVAGTDIDWLAGRMFWMLEYLGAVEVVMLDGGFAKWTADGRTISTTPKTLPPATFTPSVVASALVTKADILAHYADTEHYAIVDSRNTADWQASRIPNAINILVGDVLNADFTMKTQLELEALFAERGISTAKQIYTHCYVGYRSSQGYFYFRLMGYNVAHYDGSWTEWNADETTPKESS